MTTEDEKGLSEEMCEDCPPVGYPTDRTRCATCPRRKTHDVMGDRFGPARSPALPDGGEGLDDADLISVGYAPGNYMSKCKDCGSTEWEADKGAIRCRPCAIAAWNARRSPPPGAEGDEGAYQRRCIQVEAVLSRLSRAALRVVSARDAFRSPDRDSHPNLVLEEAEAWIELQAVLSAALPPVVAEVDQTQAALFEAMAAKVIDSPVIASLVGSSFRDPPEDAKIKARYLTKMAPFYFEREDGSHPREPGHGEGQAKPSELEAQLSARIEALEAGLKPFADVAPGIGGEIVGLYDEERYLPQQFDLPASHFRRARELIEGGAK